MSVSSSAALSFQALGLAGPVLDAVTKAGYQSPTPIQAQTIPLLLAGRDVVGQAQTGTGKTAAFALPILSGINTTQRQPQALILTPTRELAIQVADALQSYASGLPNVRILAIYGGQDYRTQLKMLKQGVQIVVGTPGRVMDHMRRGTLNLQQLSMMVLDEADEMLRMGFIDDVEWILEQTPAQRQTALFSATMPKPIRRIAQKYLRDPEEVAIKERTATAATIRQRYCLIQGRDKLDALLRILEVEQQDGTIVFVRTKNDTVTLAEQLNRNNWAAVALNGDMPQKNREQTIEQLKSGRLDILVATDVVARGLDIERISHVINYDIPSDSESYVHRIGRTGRAGRKGEAILFVTPRERRSLQNIEKATRQPISEIQLPDAATINKRRIEKFAQRISEAVTTGRHNSFHPILEQIQQTHDLPMQDIAAALASLLQGKKPLLMKDLPTPRKEKPASSFKREKIKPGKSEKKTARRHDKTVKFDTYRIEVGATNKVKPGHIVGAIANETGLKSDFIGQITIHDDFSTVDLPTGLPKEIFRTLQSIWVANRQLNISRV